MKKIAIIFNTKDFIKISGCQIVFIVQYIIYLIIFFKRSTS